MTDVTDRLAAALADHYSIERELGHGGMATVHLARDLKHGRTVAIKVLRPELAEAVGGARFLREINIAAQPQSPHILPLLDSGEADGHTGAAASTTIHSLPPVTVRRYQKRVVAPSYSGALGIPTKRGVSRADIESARL